MPRVGRISLPLDVGLLGGFLVSGLLFGLVALAPWLRDPEHATPPEAGAAIIVGGCVAGFWMTWAILTWNGWAAIQDGHAALTPRQAVLPLLIPLFNLYWVFRCYCGLARGMHAFAARHRTPGVQLDEGACVWYAALFGVSFVPVIGLLSLAACMVSVIPLAVALGQSINAIAAAQEKALGRLETRPERAPSESRTRCPRCGTMNTARALVCADPHCKFTLRRKCTNCGKSVAYSRLACARCGCETDLARYAKGNYDLTTIAVGGVGEIARAEHKSTGEVHAFKTLRARHREDQAALEAFEHGAAVLMSLSAPGVLKVLAFIDDVDLPYYVMPFLSGGTLAQYMGAAGPLPWQEAARICIDITYAVEYLHHNGILHRDLKPSNLTRECPEGRFVITDFDTALAPDAGSTKVGTGEGGYTLEYAAPEQLNGDPADSRVDVYALGTILYEMITGNRGLEWTQRLAAYAHPGSFGTPRIPIGTGLGRATEEMSNVVAKATVIPPKHRYADMAAFREALLRASAATR